MSRRSSKVSSHDQEDLIYDCKAAYIAVFGDVNTDIRTKQELMEALEMTGRNPTQKALKTYWTSDRRSLSFDDFVDICRKEPPPTNDDLIKAFKKIDINGDGFITVDELHRIMTQKGEKMSIEEVREIIADIDENGDGKLDYEEYCNMVNKTVQECKKVSRKMMEKKEKKRKSEFSDSKRGDGPVAGSMGSQLSIVSNSSQRRERQQSSRPASAQRLMGRRDSAEGTIDGKGNVAAETKDDDDDDIQTSATKKSSAGRTDSQVSLRKKNTDMGSQVSVKSASARETSPKQKSRRVPIDVSDDENVVEEDNPPISSRSQRSARNSSGSVLSFKKFTEDDTAVGSKLSQHSLKSHKTGDMTNGSHASLRSEGNVAADTKDDDDDTQTSANKISSAGRTDSQVSLRKKNTDMGSQVSVQSASARDTSPKQKSRRIPSDVSDDENVVEEDNPPISSRSQRSIRSSSGSVFSFMKSTEDDAAVGSKLSQQSLKSPNKSGDMTNSSHSSLRSADRISGSRRSLLSIGDKDLSTPVPAQRKSLSRSLFPELQDDFPKPSPRNKKDGVISHGPPSRLSSLAQPKNLGEWTHTSIKGAFFIDEESIVCHQYELELKEETQVWITIQPTSTKSMIIGGEGRPIDTALLIHSDRNSTMEVTEKRDAKGKYGIKTTLRPGTYNLVPFTTGCHLKPRTGSKSKEKPLVKKDREGKTTITKAFRQALMEIFYMCDLDGNGTMSKEEFSWFNWRTSGELVTEEEWKVVEENVELEDGELTVSGFIRLNELEAEDGDGDTEDLWVTLESMGYNKELFMDETCPFILNVYTEDCDNADLTVSKIEPVDKKIIIRSIMEKGERTKVKSMKDLEMYTYSNATRASFVIENTSYSKVKVEVDCSNSKNCISNRDTLSEKITVLANSQEIGHHLVPADESLDWTVRTSEIIHK